MTIPTSLFRCRSEGPFYGFGTSFNRTKPPPPSSAKTEWRRWSFGVHGPGVGLMFTIAKIGGREDVVPEIERRWRGRGLSVGRPDDRDDRCTFEWRHRKEGSSRNLTPDPIEKLRFVVSEPMYGVGSSFSRTFKLETKMWILRFRSH